MITNDYSAMWFELFSRNIDPLQTAREVDFISRHLPIHQYARLLDLCCGEGRHAAALAARGYQVTGIDKSPDAVRATQPLSRPGLEVVQMDAREIARLPRKFHGVICMWQSFGYFDRSANAALLADLTRVVGIRGRLILDVYNADFFRQVPGLNCWEKSGVRIEERKQLDDGRLRVELAYGASGSGDSFDWEVYTPQELERMLGAAGWSVHLACSGFDETMTPSDRQPRMQFVAERREST